MMSFSLMALEGTGGLDNLVTVVAQIFTWVSSGVSTITGSPLLLLSTGIFAAGASIGLMKRFIGH